MTRETLFFALLISWQVLSEVNYEYAYEYEFKDVGNCDFDLRMCSTTILWLVPAGRRISVGRQGAGGYAGCGQALSPRAVRS